MSWKAFKIFIVSGKRVFKCMVVYKCIYFWFNVISNISIEIVVVNLSYIRRLASNASVLQSWSVNVFGIFPKFPITTRVFHLVAEQQMPGIYFVRFEFSFLFARPQRTKIKILTRYTVVCIRPSPVALVIQTEVECKRLLENALRQCVCSLSLSVPTYLL